MTLYSGTQLPFTTTLDSDFRKTIQNRGHNIANRIDLFGKKILYL